MDLNFGGDAASWTAVAYTLKARFHIHWGEATGAGAYTAALAAAQNGIQDVSGTWKAIHTSDPNENNLWFQFQRDRVGHLKAGDFLVPLMVADADPRLPMYFSNAGGGGYAPRDSELSATGYGAPTFDVPILTCAENAFIIAEVQFAVPNEPGAISAAQDGLTCQEDEWGIDLSTTAATIAGLTGAPLLAEIMNQKYIALFLNAEAYNDYKRTCLPAITERPGGMPGRLFYGQDERQSNSNIPEPAQQPLRNANDPAPCWQEVNLNRGAGRLFTGLPALRLVRSVVVKIAQLPLYLMALLLAAEGCFQYVPEGDVAPTRGSPIRVHLERPTSFELTQFTVNNVIRVDGEMVRREAGDVILSATWLDAVTGVGFAGEGWTLSIPETTVTALELKKISWWRMGAAVLGGALVTILGFDLLGTGTEGSGGGGGSVNPL